jgi:hypothetical protein
VLLVASLPLAIRCFVLLQPKPKASTVAVEQQLGVMVNAARQAQGLAPYYIHPALTDVARAHAAQMAAEANFEKPPAFQWLQEQLRLSGYGLPLVGLGMRMGVVYRTRDGGLSAPQAFSKWVEEERGKPEPQDRSILNPSFLDLGVGVCLDEPTGVYYVAFVFAKRQIALPPKEKDNRGQ